VAARRVAVRLAFDSLKTCMPRKKRAPLTPDTPVAELWNLSSTTAGWLNDAGVFTHEDLVATDLVTLWQRLKGSHRQVTRLMYYALVGAMHDCHWKEISPSAIADFEKRMVLTNEKPSSRRSAALKTPRSSATRRSKSSETDRRVPMRPRKSKAHT
jgi:hypothetical protein